MRFTFLALFLALLTACAPGSTDETSAAPPIEVEQPIVTRILLLDSQTEAPIAGATLDIAETGVRLTADDNGAVEVEVPWGESLRLSGRHPSYAATHQRFDQQGWAQYPVYLRARSADTFAQVMASSEDQVVRLGRVTIDVPGGSLTAGTRLHISLADARTAQQPDAAPNEAAALPLIAEQIRVDLPDLDPWAFHYVVDGNNPLRARIQLTDAEALAARLAGMAVYGSAGPNVDGTTATLDADGVVSFPIVHFSDVSVTTFAQLSGGCDGQPYVLEYWRLEADPTKLVTELYDAQTRDCGDTRPVQLSGTVKLSTSAEAKTSGAEGLKTSSSAAVLAGVKAKVALVAGGAGKALIGYTGTDSTNDRLTAGTSLKANSSQSLKVSRAVQCDPGYPCEAQLHVTLATRSLRYVRRVVSLSAILGPQVTVSGSCIGGEGQTRVVTVTPGLSPLQIADKGACFAELINITGAFGDQQAIADRNNTGGRCTRQELDALLVRLGSPGNIPGEAVYEEATQYTETVFQGAEVKIYRQRGKDACPGFVGELPPEAPSGMGATPRLPADTVDECAERLPRTAPSAPADALVPRDGEFALNARPISLGVIDGGQVTVTPRLFVDRTVTVGDYREVAFAAACCEQPTTSQVSFTSSLAVSVTGRESKRLARASVSGIQSKFEAEGGADILIAEATAVLSVDLKETNGLEQVLSQTLGKTQLLSRQNSATATATSTTGRCEAQGVYAFRRRTFLTLTVDITFRDRSVTRTYDVIADYWGAPQAGPLVRKDGHCSDPDAAVEPVPQDPPADDTPADDTPDDTPDDDTPGDPPPADPRPVDPDTDEPDQTPENEDQLGDDRATYDPLECWMPPFPAALNDRVACVAAGTMQVLDGARVTGTPELGATVVVPVGTALRYRVASPDTCTFSVVTARAFERPNEAGPDDVLIAPVAISSDVNGTIYVLTAAQVQRLAAESASGPVAVLMDFCEGSGQAFGGVSFEIDGTI